MLIMHQMIFNLLANLNLIAKLLENPKIPFTNKHVIIVENLIRHLRLIQSYV
jgi:hypothetical protein